MNYGMRFVTLYRRQGSRPSPWKRNAKNKMAVWGCLTNSCEKKRSEKQRRKGKLYPFSKTSLNIWMFRYDLNQIPYNYTVEVRSRFKGLDLINRVPDELWRKVRDIVQETGIKTIPIEKKCKKAK